jgi:hypothetical protein
MHALGTEGNLARCGRCGGRKRRLLHLYVEPSSEHQRLRLALRFDRVLFLREHALLCAVERLRREPCVLVLRGLPRELRRGPRVPVPVRERASTRFGQRSIGPEGSITEVTLVPTP